MGTRPTKAASNIYCRCRLEAAKYNERLNSREGAAELLGCSTSTLSDYELGITKNVPPDMVIKMADLYNAPELKNHYCANDCPIGRMSVVELDGGGIDRLTLQMLASLSQIDSIKRTLIDVAADGVISDEEVPKFQEVLQSLETISKSAQELKLWAEKTLLVKGD